MHDRSLARLCLFAVTDDNFLDEQLRGSGSDVRLYERFFRHGMRPYQRRSRPAPTTRTLRASRPLGPVASSNVIF